MSGSPKTLIYQLDDVVNEESCIYLVFDLLQELRKRRLELKDRDWSFQQEISVG
jgi:hypothetical protein